MGQAFDQFHSNGIGHVDENNGYCRRRLLGGYRCLLSDRNQNIRSQSCELVRKTHKTFRVFVGKPLLKRNRLAIDVAKTIKTLLKCSQIYCLFLSTTCMPEHPDPRNFLGVLSMRGRQPSYEDPAHSFDKIAAPHGRLPRSMREHYIGWDHWMGSGSQCLQ